MLSYGCAGMGNVHLCQFVGGEEHDFFAVFVLQHLDKGFVSFHIDGAIAVGAGQDALTGKSLVYLVVDKFVVFRMVCQAKADGSHHGHKVQFEHTVGGMTDEGRDDDEQLEFLWVGLLDIVDEGDMVGECLFQIVGSFVTDFQEQGCGSAVDKCKNAVVHVLNVTCHRPIETLLEGVECPKSSVVTLGGNDGVGIEDSGDLVGKVVGSTDVSGEDGDGVLTQCVNTHNGGVGMLVFDEWGDGADADAECSDEDEGIVVVPVGRNLVAA